MFGWRGAGGGASTPLPVRVVFRWDLDKTYLKSEFESLRGLVRISLEKAEDKVAAPGVTVLLRSLRHVAEQAGRDVRVYFLTGSPPQIAGAIERKLQMDGIVYDGIVFKDQLQQLMRGKFRHLREQVGYKVTELLKARMDEPGSAREYLFGDDWETDPLTYSLYADTVAGRLTPEGLEEILRTLRADPELVRRARELASAVPRAEAVGRIFINLERRTAPAKLRAFGPRLVPTFNYFQTAACLFAEGMLAAVDVAAVARSLRDDSGYGPSRIANSLADLIRRGHIDESAAAPLRSCLVEDDLLLPSRTTLRGRIAAWGGQLLARESGMGRVVAVVRGLGRPVSRRSPVPAAPVAVDYRTLLAQQESGE